MMGNGLTAINGAQTNSNNVTNATTSANNQTANAATSQAGSLANSFNSGIGSITQGINAYSTANAANNPTYGTTASGNPIYFTGT